MNMLNEDHIGWKEKVKIVFQEAGIELLRDMTNPVDIIGKPVMAKTFNLEKANCNKEYIQSMPIQFKKFAMWKVIDFDETSLVIRGHCE